MECIITCPMQNTHRFARMSRKSGQKCDQAACPRCLALYLLLPTPRPRKSGAAHACLVGGLHVKAVHHGDVYCLTAKWAISQLIWYWPISHNSSSHQLEGLIAMRQINLKFCRCQDLNSEPVVWQSSALTIRIPKSPPTFDLLSSGHNKFSELHNAYTHAAKYLNQWNETTNKK